MSEEEPKLVPNNEMLEQVLRNQLALLVEAWELQDATPNVDKLAACLDQTATLLERIRKR